MLASRRPAYADLTALCKRIPDFHTNLGEGTAKATIERIQALCPGGVGSAVVDNCARREHLGNRFTPPFIPYLLKPPPSQVTLEIGHG
jgi:hypothetical protein